MSGLLLLTDFHCTAGLSFTGSHGTIDTGQRPLSDGSVGLGNLTARHLAFPSRMAGPQAAGERHEPCPRVSTVVISRRLRLAAAAAGAASTIVALCDVYAPYLNAEYDKVDPRFASLGQRIPRMPELPADVARVKDFRTVLDRPDIDAVVIATPDHWHAIQTIAACNTGKDVYVEKPLSITIAEGRAMVEAARRHERIVQVGTHRRSSRMYLHLADLVRSRVPGKVTVARAAYCSNMATKGIGHAPMTMTTQIRFPFPRFFRSTGASGKCFSSQRVRPQSTRRGATVLVRTKSFPCQVRVIWRWRRSMARIVARATVSGDIVRR